MDSEPVTEKQVNFMKSLGVDIPNGVTKTEARFIIDRAVAKADESDRPARTQPKPVATEFLDERNTTMYVSYVKDLVVSGKDLTEAIDMIKLAIKEFS